MPVVKADAYGHGAVAVARALVGLGAPMLAVAYAEEGAALRAAGIQVPIVIGIGSLLLGIPIMFMTAAKLRPYFRRKTEVAPPGLI